jgi:hypothetical protein
MDGRIRAFPHTPPPPTPKEILFTLAMLGNARSSSPARYTTMRSSNLWPVMGCGSSSDAALGLAGGTCLSAPPSYVRAAASLMAAVFRNSHTVNGSPPHSSA